MYDMPTIVYVFNLFWNSQNWIETFLKLSPMEQTYIDMIAYSLAGILLPPTTKLVKAGFRKLMKRLRDKS